MKTRRIGFVSPDCLLVLALNLLNKFFGSLASELWLGTIEETRHL